MCWDCVIRPHFKTNSYARGLAALIRFWPHTPVIYGTPALHHGLCSGRVHFAGLLRSTFVMKADLHAATSSSSLLEQYDWVLDKVMGDARNVVQAWRMGIPPPCIPCSASCNTELEQAEHGFQHGNEGDEKENMQPWSKSGSHESKGQAHNERQATWSERDKDIILRHVEVCIHNSVKPDYHAIARELGKCHLVLRPWPPPTHS